jgi:hypothetical protein
VMDTPLRWLGDSRLATLVRPHVGRRRTYFGGWGVVLGVGSMHFRPIHRNLYGIGTITGSDRHRNEIG